MTFNAVAGGQAQPELVVTGVAAGTGYAPQYAMSAGALGIVNPAIDDVIDFTNVSMFDLFSSGGDSSLSIASATPTFNQDLGASGASVDVTVEDGAGRG